MKKMQCQRCMWRAWEKGRLKKHVCKFTLFYIMGFNTWCTPKLKIITRLLTVACITLKADLFVLENKIRFSHWECRRSGSLYGWSSLARGKKEGTRVYGPIRQSTWWDPESQEGSSGEASLKLLTRQRMSKKRGKNVTDEVTAGSRPAAGGDPVRGN